MQKALFNYLQYKISMQKTQVHEKGRIFIETKKRPLIFTSGRFNFITSYNLF